MFLFIQGITKWVLDNLSYWVIVLFMAIESSFIPFPSEVIVPPAAWLSATPDSDLNIFLVILSATLGAVIGALVNYALALWLGRPIVYAFANSRFGHMCLIDQEKVETAERFFDKHGAVSTFVGRLIPAVRQLISIPAGLARMGLSRFVLFTTLGAGIWNTVLAALGYYCSRIPGLETKEQVVELAGKYSHEIGYALFAIVACIVVFLIYKGLKK
ncbi:MAG: DedA family protein [Bacteroidales bacterium]|nr:DedA family protein [Bacteroidales bacterium]